MIALLRRRPPDAPSTGSGERVPILESKP